MAAPAPQTGRLRGEIPDTFAGDRAKTRKFKQQFKIYRGLNDNHEVMQTPYYRTMQALSLIKGPLVDDWKDDQIDELVEKVSRAANPIGRDEDRLWDEFVTAFDSAFTDSTQKQKAHAAIQQIKMRQDDLDGYVATFKHLAKESGYALDAEGTIHLFARGLKPGLLDAILHRDTQPNTMDEWVTQAQTEQQKFARRQAMRNPNFARYEWTQPTAKRNGHRRHANDETVPMDVDPPVYGRLRQARTEADKSRFQIRGQCFYCERQGHMARDCPQKKKQFFGRSDQPRSRSDQERPGYRQPPSGSNQGFKKKFYGSPKPTQGFRKSNKPRQYTPRVRTATIEEAEEDEYQDDYYGEEEEVQSLAVRTAKLSDDQKELWVSEMKDVGINFQ